MYHVWLGVSASGDSEDAGRKRKHSQISPIKWIAKDEPEPVAGWLVVLDVHLNGISWLTASSIIYVFYSSFETFAVLHSALGG